MLLNFESLTIDAFERQINALEIVSKNSTIINKGRVQNRYKFIAVLIMHVMNYQANGMFITMFALV